VYACLYQARKSRPCTGWKEVYVTRGGIVPGAMKEEEGWLTGGWRASPRGTASIWGAQIWVYVVAGGWASVTAVVL
jgi:hypothetical protein